MEAALTEAIRSLAAQLTELAPRGRRAVSLAIGEELDDHGPDLPMGVTPRDQQFTSATVAARSDSSTVNYVQLDLADKSATTAADLGREFGRYSAPPRVHPGSQTQIVFREPVDVSVVLIVDVTPDSTDIAGALATAITLRYDGP